MGVTESLEYVQNIITELRQKCLAPSGPGAHTDARHLLDGLQALVHSSCTELASPIL